MQDRYAGDIGDFGKLILLNLLSTLGKHIGSLGVNWYYVKTELRPSSDGSHIGYLEPSHRRAEQFKACSPTLYDTLGRIVRSGHRSIHHLEQAGVLPPGTKTYGEALPQQSFSSSNRMEKRMEWFQKSLASLLGSSIVFLDPDNGIQTPSLARREPRSVKYAFVDEIGTYHSSGATVITYNHRDRSPRAIYEAKIGQLRRLSAHGSLLVVVRFKRISVRDYVILARPEHVPIINELRAIFAKPPLDFLFDFYRFEVR